ncbi:4'-phosphopantetheinyl transferase family protein [Streptomyces carpinensis]|uniref:4'-phosphopantetheinyl transferase family protein n=1 Tax=Streptomyces carpinensis TaxID=66369 RepID=UPI000A3621D1|nr:4'-phosphopantetheinyl transferase superfamily protein [Streptomyces carpinensis]
MTPPPVLRLVRTETQADPSTLDARERRRAFAFARAAYRDRYVTAHTELRRLLAVRLGIAPRQVTLAREPCPVCGAPHGRPAVAAGAPHFSLAYSADLCLIALAATPVGVDMEAVPPPDVAAQLACGLHPRERTELAALPEEERPLAFTRIWVRKEAYLKGLGTGLAKGLSTDYLGAGAAAAEGPPGWTIADIAMDSSLSAAIALRHG